MAKCRRASGQEYKAAVSVGWNPTYDNSAKTVEAYLISDQDLVDFYDENVNLHLLRYVRPEALYSDFDSLIIAISADIQSTITSEF